MLLKSKKNWLIISFSIVLYSLISVSIAKADLIITVKYNDGCFVNEAFVEVWKNADFTGEVCAGYTNKHGKLVCPSSSLPECPWTYWVQIFKPYPGDEKWAGAGDVNGTCYGTVNPILTEDTCPSGYCVDGYCCDSACSGNCDRCDVSGNEGTCTDVDSLCDDVFSDYLGMCGWQVAYADCLNGVCEAEPDYQEGCNPYIAFFDNTACWLYGLEHCSQMCGAECDEDIDCVSGKCLDDCTCLKDTTPPVITVYSPGSTYYSTLIYISIKINEATSWIGYSLDNQANKTLWTNQPAGTYSKYITVSYDNHNIIFYANDTSGNMGASDKVYFTVKKIGGGGGCGGPAWIGCRLK